MDKRYGDNSRRTGHADLLQKTRSGSHRCGKGRSLLSSNTHGKSVCLMDGRWKIMRLGFANLISMVRVGAWWLGWCVLTSFLILLTCHRSLFVQCCTVPIRYSRLDRFCRVPPSLELLHDPPHTLILSFSRRTTIKATTEQNNGTIT